MLHEMYVAQERRATLLAEAERERLARQATRAARAGRVPGRSGLLRRVLARTGHGDAERRRSSGTGTGTRTATRVEGRPAPVRGRRARA